MSIPAAVPKRRKRSPEQAREEALAAARELLLTGGPKAVTLSNVGKAVGMTHANVIHHFGSAAELQSALMGSMVADLAESIEEAVAHVRSDEAAPRQLVDIVFDAFANGGAGMLAAWMALSQEISHFEPVSEVVKSLVKAIEERAQIDMANEAAHRRVTSAVLLISLCAFGDSVIGDPLREMLGRDKEAARRVTARLLPVFFEGDG
ncbi:MAG TPA: TetR family transcriptional regulator [Caulobacteraceae bacterium]|nr:TetR family transcriptional regulator [Caulobacteraceae bacterium]